MSTRRTPGKRIPLRQTPTNTRRPRRPTTTTKIKIRIRHRRILPLLAEGYLSCTSNGGDNAAVFFCIGRVRLVAAQRGPFKYREQRPAEGAGTTLLCFSMGKRTRHYS